LGYLGDDWIPFLKITLTDPKSVPKVRDKFLRVNYSCAPRLIAIVPLRLFERGECEFRGLFEGITATYESNIVFTLRFMIDSKVDCILNNHLNMPHFIPSGRWHELDRSPCGEIQNYSTTEQTVHMPVGNRRSVSTYGFYRRTRNDILSLDTTLLFHMPLKAIGQRLHLCAS